MSIVSRLASWWQGKSNSNSSSPQSWMVDWVRGGDKSASGVNINQLEALRDIATMACVSIRASDLAKLPLHVKRRLKNGGSEIMRSHWVERLLRKPNAYQTKMEFFETMQACYLLKGNAFAPILWNGRGEATAMIPVNPERVALMATPTSDLFYRVTKSNWFEFSELVNLPTTISAEDMFHLRGMMISGLLGLSRIGMGRDGIGLSRALENYSSMLFANGARPSGVLETDKRLQDATFRRFKQQWDNEFTGLENAAKTPILEEGLKWKPQTMTSVESQTIEARKFQVEQIAMAFDVPLHRLGVVTGSGGPAILQAHQMYLNNTLSSDAERWENKLNDMFGLDGEEMFVEFDLDYFNRADMQTRYTALRTGVIGGFIKINEARRQEGLPDVTGGDVLMQPTNMAPFPFTPPTPGAGPGSDTSGSPADGGDGDPSAPPTKDFDFDPLIDALSSEADETRNAIRDLMRAQEDTMTREEFLLAMKSMTPAPPQVTVNNNQEIKSATLDVADAKVLLPEQPPPTVIVNVPQQAAPEVKVAAPTVNFTPRRSKKITKVKHDDKGRIVQTITEEE